MISSGRRRLDLLEMGRRRTELRRIEDRASREVCFSKRRRGLLKKAEELAVLCDVEIGLLIFSSKGKLYHFSNPLGMDNIIARYRKFSDAERNVNKASREAQFRRQGSACTQKNYDLVETTKRPSAEVDLSSAFFSELAQMEEELDGLLMQTKSKKAQLMMHLIAKLEDQAVTKDKETAQWFGDGGTAAAPPQDGPAATGEASQLQWPLCPPPIYMMRHDCASPTN